MDNVWSDEQKLMCMELGESEPHSMHTFHSVVLKYTFLYMRVCVCVLCARVHAHMLRAFTRWA